MFFAWLKRRTKHAILAGFEEAVQEIDGTPDAPDALAALRQRLLPPPAAPEAPAPGPARRGRKEASS